MQARLLQGRVGRLEGQFAVETCLGRFPLRTRACDQCPYDYAIAGAIWTGELQQCTGCTVPAVSCAWDPVFLLQYPCSLCTGHDVLSQSSMSSSSSLPCLPGLASPLLGDGVWPCGSPGTHWLHWPGVLAISSQEYVLRVVLFPVGPYLTSGPCVDFGLFLVLIPPPHIQCPTFLDLGCLHISLVGSALNSRIGSSGATAYPRGDLAFPIPFKDVGTTSVFGSADTGLTFLVLCLMQRLGSALCILFRSIWAAFGCSVVAFLYGRAFRVYTSGRRPYAFKSVIVKDVVKVAGLARPGCQLLQWHPWTDRKGRPSKRRRPSLSVRPSGGCVCRLMRFAVGLLGWQNLPWCVWASPKQLLGDMARIQNFVDSIPERLPVASSSMTAVPTPSGTQGADSEGHRYPETVALPLREQVLTPAGHGWLGVQVYAFGEATRCFGMRFDTAPTFVGTLCRVRRLLQAEHAWAIQVAPISPPPLGGPDGHACFVVFPAFLNRLRRILVILDLTRVGGHYFAHVVPACVDFAQLVSELEPHFGPIDENHEIRVGQNQQLVDVRSQLLLEHGDVIAFLPAGFGPDAPAPVHELFNNRLSWGQLGHMLVPAPIRSVAIFFRGQQFAWPLHRIGDRELLDVVSSRFHVPSACLRATHLRGLPGLTVYGESCDSLVVIEEGEAEIDVPFCRQPRGFLTVCDLRVVGFLPRVFLGSAGPVSEAELIRGTDLPDGILRQLSLQVISAEADSDLCALFELSYCETEGPASIPRRLDPEDPSDPYHAERGLNVAGYNPGGRTTDSDEDSDNDGSSPEESHDADAPNVVKFLVLRVGYTPLDVSFRVGNRPSIPQVLDRLSFALDDRTYQLFSLVRAATEQPSDTWGLAVAMPAWAADEPYCVIDLRQVDGRLFTALLPDTYTREQLCSAIALADARELEIWNGHENMPFGSPRAFPRRVLGSILVVPAGAPRPQTFDLAYTLRHLEHWDPNVSLPVGPERHRAQEVCIVLEEGCRLFVLRSGRAQYYMEDLAEEFAIPLHWVSVQVARPGIADVMWQGHRCRGVAAVSRLIPNVPLPPRRPWPRQYLVLIDCRPLLMEWTHWLVENDECLHSELVEHFEFFAPSDHQVQVEGAPLEGDRLLVSPGHVLVTQFVPITPSSHRPSSAISHRDMDVAATSGPEANSDRSPASPRQLGSFTRQSEDRSRSPRNGATECGDRMPTSAGWAKFDSLAVSIGSAKCLQLPLPMLHPLFSSPLFRGLSVALEGGLVPFCKILSISDAGSQPTPTESKLLVDPVCTNAVERDRLSALHTANRQLTDHWNEATPDEVFGPESPRSTISFASGREVMQWLHFAVLTPGYAAELIAVALVLPATPAEAAEAVSDARSDADREFFPFLVPAAPQPCIGNGVYVACPHWSPTANVVCFDLSSLDGRVFAAVLPVYTNKHGLLRFLGLPQRTPYDVYVGDSDDVIADDAEVHLHPGITIAVMLAGTPAPLHQMLAQLLLMTDAWCATSIFPSDDAPNTHGIVTPDLSQACHVDLEGHLCYNDQVAASIGAAAQSFSLTVAKPPVTDAVFTGFRCSAVVAALPSESLRSMCIVDGRALLKGWWLFPIVEGILSVNALLEAAAPEVPLPWVPRIKDVPPGQLHVLAMAGQVFSIILADPGRPSVVATQPPDVSGATMEGPPVEHGTAPLSTGSEESARSSDTPLDGESNTVTHAPDASLITSIVFRPHYHPELHELSLELPAEEGELLMLLHGARQLFSDVSLQRLITVCPQPLSSCALVLAAPIWGLSCAFVLIDIRFAERRLFARTLPKTLFPRDVLSLLRVPAGEPVDIYIGSLPWPAPLHQIMHINDGDLVQILPAARSCSIVAFLPDMLQDPFSWLIPPEIPGRWEEVHWVLSAHQCIDFVVDRHRIADFRTRLAHRIGIEVRSLRLQVPHPRIRDYEAYGSNCRAVVAALDDARHPLRHEAGAVFFLDMRPLAMDLICAHTPSGIVDVAALRALLCGQVPAPYVVNVEGGDPTPEGPAGFRRVRPGEVLVCVVQGQVHSRLSSASDTEGGGANVASTASAQRAHHDVSQGLPVSRPSSASLQVLLGVTCLPGSQALGISGLSRSEVGPWTKAVSQWDALSVALFVSLALGCLLFLHAYTCMRRQNAPPWYACLYTGWLSFLLRGPPDMHVLSEALSPCWACHGCTREKICMWEPCSKHDVLSVDHTGFTPAHLVAFAVFRLAVGDMGLPRWMLWSASWLPCVLKLLTEPESQSLEARDRIEDVRDFEEGEGRAWPYLPAGDPFAEQRLAERAEMEDEEFVSEVEAEFTFCLLSPGLTSEPVVVSLATPTEIPDALQAVQDAREPERSQPFPMLVVLDPQPTQTFGVLLALPTWADQEIFVGFSLLDIDDRLFTALVPPVASREQLLEIAGLVPTELFDIYVEGGVTPLLFAEEVTLTCGACIFCLHRDTLPGPYFHLAKTLFSSASWETDPSLPYGPAEGFMCFVSADKMCRLHLEEDTSFPDGSVIAEALGISSACLLIQPATPVTRDVTIDGFYCYNVCAALDLSHYPDGTVPPCIILLDCRALLQGWQIITVPQARVSRLQLLADLSVFVPLGWSVALAGLGSDDDPCEVTSGQVVVASCFRDVHPWQGLPPARGSDSVDMSGASADAEHVSGHSDSPDGSRQDVHERHRTRSRSPYRQHGRLDAELPASHAPFLLIGQEYSPEIVLGSLAVEEVDAVLESVQFARDDDCRRRFGDLVPAYPQPARAYGVAVVKPTWSDDVFVVFDLLLVNGTIFCWLASPVMTRASLLAASGLPPTDDIDVHVPDQDMPLDNLEPCRLSTGSCVTFVPASRFRPVPLSLAELLSHCQAWSTDAPLPCAPEEWLYVLTDSGPCCLQIAASDEATVAQAVASAFGPPSALALFQLALPPLDNFADEGRLTWNVAVYTRDGRVRGADPGIVYFLDMRAILCGITWAIAPDGIVSITLIQSQCARPAAGGHQVEVLGGTRRHADDFDTVLVQAGEVLTVQVAAAPGDGTTHAAQGDSAEDGRDGSNAPHGAAPRGGSAGTEDAPRSSDGAHHGGADNAGSSFPPYSPGPVSHAYRPPPYDPPAIALLRLSLLLCAGIFCGPGALIFISYAIYACRLQRCVTVVVALSLVHLPAVTAVQLPPHICNPDITSRVASGDVVGQRSSFRGIPTPCRAAFSNPYSRPDGVNAEIAVIPPEEDEIVTLLEQCVRAGSCTAFFDTAALVETLYEHFGFPHETTEDVSTVDAAKPAHFALDDPDTDMPCQLLLSQLVDPPRQSTDKPLGDSVSWFSLDWGGCALPVTEVHWRDLSRFTPMRSLLKDITGLHAPDRFSAWCASGGQALLSADVSALCFTSDGSYAQVTGQAGWGLVISALSPSCPDVPGTFLGYAAYDAAELWRMGGGDTDASAFGAEIAGLFWAAVAAFQIPFSGHFVFRCDNEAALGIAAGSHVASEHPTVMACQNLHLALSLRFPHRVSHQHVRGHSGDAANELADAVANKGSEGVMPSVFSLDLPLWFAQNGNAFRWLPHLCWSLARPQQGPVTASGFMRWELTEPAAALSAQQIMRPFTRSFPAEPKPGKSTATLALAFASFNVLSIASPGEDNGFYSGVYGQVGRVALLDRSLHSAGVYVAGLQETRTPEGRLDSQHFRRYCSGCLDKRAFGIEVWVGIYEGCPEHKAVVLHASPTRLLLRLSFAGLHLGVFAGHGLHRGHPSAARLAWWKETSDLCLVAGASLDWIWLVDGNCPLGSVTSRHVGDLSAEDEDEASDAMHCLLRACGCWVPNTFDDSFSGPTGTLVQKRSNVLVRRDYVALPLGWRDCVTHGYVSDTIHAGHAIPDHYAVVIQVTLTIAQDKDARFRGRIDGDALLLPCNEEAVNDILASLPRVPWDVNVNDHISYLTEALYQGLARRFPRQRRRMRQGFLSEEAAGVHAVLAGYRHALRWRMSELRRCYHRCAFDAWKQQLPFYDVFRGRWIWHLRVAIGRLTLAVSAKGREIRRLCRRDRAAHLNQLAIEVDEADPTSVHKALRRVLRPKKFRRSGPEPLPRLKQPGGQYCQTPAEIADEWRRHFSDLEGGTTMQVEDFVREGLARQASTEGFPALSCDALPEFSSVLSAFQKVKAQKAAGPDLIPPSICKRFAFRLSEHFWPIILKTFVHLSEPLPLKGGVLHHIPKPNPPVRDVAAAQRGILVQSTFSKVLHRVCRPFPAQLVEARAPVLQIGGRPGRTYMFGSFISRCFLSYAKFRGVSAGIVFTDLVAAYYSVVREAVTGLAGSDASVQDVAASLGLAAADMQELEAYARDSPALAGPDSSDFLRALTLELHADTWFHLSGDPCLVRTARGTRPGGCLADTVFSLLFQKVLARREPAEDCNIPSIPWTGIRELRLFQCGELANPPCVRVEDIIYADDHASCVTSPSAAGLGRAVRNSAGRTLDSISGHGLAANIGPRKTASLMVHRGVGARLARDQVFGQGKGRLHVLRENNLPILLDAVPQYRHLGTLLTHTGSLLPEVRSRLAVARATLGEGRRKVFCCAQVVLARRVTLFQVHVMSALLSGVGAWPELGKEAWHVFEQGITSMYRQLLRIRPGCDQHWSRDAIFVACNAPSPTDSLEAERLRFLGQLLRGGPDAAWALLQHDPAAVAGFRGALRWLSDAVSATCDLPSVVVDCQAWLSLASSKAKWWKGLIKRGLAWHQGARRSRVAYTSFCRSVWCQAPKASDAVGEHAHACLLCSRAFTCHQTWASHAALQHGYRTKAVRFARGRRCQACGAEFACLRRLRQHLNLHPRCLQSLEREDASLLPTLETAGGHVQSRAVAGRGCAHLPAAQEDVSWGLLAELRARAADEDSAILEIVRTFVEPFPTLRATLQMWASELAPSAQLDAVSDLLLCFTPFWICDQVACQGRNQADEPFLPNLVPLLWQPRPAGLAGLLVDFPELKAPAVSAATPGGGWRSFPFRRLPHYSLDFACAIMCFPAPPCPCTSFWSTGSCPLRSQRAHHSWLSLCLEWLRVAFRLASAGRRCHLFFSFSSETAGELGQWIHTCTDVPEHKRTLFLRFT